MWEIDKKYLQAYKECVATTLSELQAKEEVDYETICIVEMAKLEKHIGKKIQVYQKRRPLVISEKKQ